MPNSYDSDTVRAVRLFIPDIDPIYGEGGDETMFSNSDIAIFLDQAKGSTMWAAGLAMIAVGNSEALIGKVIRNYETETDASKLQREWRAAGVELIKQARAVLSDDDGDFLIAVFPDFGNARHPEGYTHGSYRGFQPGSYQW